MPLTLITAPTVEPLTVAEVKRELRLGASAGEPAPTVPTVALASPAAAGNCTNGAHRVGITCVTADGETEIGPLSDVVTVADQGVNGQIAVSGIALGGTAVTSRKVYLTEAGGSTAKLAATIANNTATTVTLNVADGSLGAEAPTTNTTEDPGIVRLITTVRERAELATGRALLTQTWDLVLDRFPEDGYIEIPKPPLSSITHIKYVDTAGDLQTWASSNYDVQAPAGPRAARGRVALGFGVSWPSTYGEIGDVTIRVVCGYGAAASAVPKFLIDTMLLDAVVLYRRDAAPKDLDTRIEQMYRSYRSHPKQRVAA